MTVALPTADTAGAPAAAAGLWMIDRSALAAALALPTSTEQERTARQNAIAAALSMHTVQEVQALILGNLPLQIEVEMIPAAIVKGRENVPFTVNVRVPGGLANIAFVEATLQGVPRRVAYNSDSITTYSIAINLTAQAIGTLPAAGGTGHLLISLQDSANNDIHEFAFLVPVISPALLDGVQSLASAAAVAWDVNKGNIANLALGHNATVTPSGGADGDTALLRVVQDATGGRTLALANSVRLGGRDAPVIASAVNARSYIMLHKHGNGWVYMGAVVDA